ncbi:MAG: fasciclin domain-containing protein [Minisyncoccia bacterium]
MKNIVETAVENPEFSTLVTAVKAADLVATLSGPGPFTVFAPTNDAFAKIPAETLQAVLADKAKLTSILTYHVVSGKVMAKDVAGMTEAKTVQGSTVKIDASNGVMINDAKVIKADIECTNGVIHVIDSVLMPK